MGLAILGTHGLNKAITNDPRFMLWDQYNPDITNTSRLYAWDILNSGSDVDINPGASGIGLHVTATVGEFSITQKISTKSIQTSESEWFTVSMNATSGMQPTRMSLVINSGSPNNGTMAIPAGTTMHAQTFDLTGIDKTTITDVELQINFTAVDLPIDTEIVFIKLEEGKNATMCSKTNIIDEINKVDSLINGLLVGTYGKTLYSEDITGKTMSLNMYTMNTGDADKLSVICRTDAGATNIDGFPTINKCSFYMDLAILKRESPTVYIAKQTIFLSRNNESYYRYIVDGVFTEWKTNLSEGIPDANSGATIKIWTGTAAQYDILYNAGTLDANTIYIQSFDADGHLLATLDSDKKLEDTQIPNTLLRVVNESGIPIHNVSFVINSDNTVSIRY